MTNHGEASMDLDLMNIAASAAQLSVLNARAAREYGPIVEDILRTGDRENRHIERTLDGLLDFCGHPPVVGLYRRLCRHYWEIDQAAAATYVQAYREMWDPESATETEGSK